MTVALHGSRLHVAGACALALLAIPAYVAWLGPPVSGMPSERYMAWLRRDWSDALYVAATVAALAFALLAGGRTERWLALVTSAVIIALQQVPGGAFADPAVIALNLTGFSALAVVALTRGPAWTLFAAALHPDERPLQHPAARPAWSQLLSVWRLAALDGLRFQPFS